MAGNLKRLRQNLADNPPKLRDTLAGNTTDSAHGQVLAWDTNTEAFHLVNNSGGGGGGGAPTDAFYFVGAASGGLSNERVLTVGSGLAYVDGGPGAAFTLSATGGGGGGAPTNAQYMVLAADSTLSQERIFTVGTGLTFVDGGAGAAFTISTTGAGYAPDNAQYFVLAADATLQYERVLTIGTGLTFTDAGAGGAFTISTTGDGQAPSTAQYVVVSTDTTLTNERVLTVGAGLSLQDGGAGAALTIAALSDVEIVPVLSSATDVRKRDSIVVASAFSHAASEYIGSTTMVGILASQQSHVTRARLFDVSTQSYIASATLTTDSTTPTRLTSSALALTTTATIYELHIDTVSAAQDDDSSIVSSVTLEVAD
ncbi:MAG: hypothetical protein CMA63_06855 [Euryarchaeota archaeon]|nr:hypothetical protein [Euryarchaeota archaeon]|tara:strand:- start:32249 stop:33358 length:1110 start_codon:yes stop_codon:yes gene_type:complete